MRSTRITVARNRRPKVDHPVTRTLQTVAAHMRTILAPATQAVCHRLAAPDLSRNLIGCAVTLERIELADIAASLAEQRFQAIQGRPRSSDGGGSAATPGTSSTTADTGSELYRLRLVGLDLREAIDRLHPDPAWPTIASGRRARTSTANEYLAATISELCAGVGTYIDLLDAVNGTEIATREVVRLARRAARARAWHGDPVDTDPPVDVHQAARCSGWPLGVDRNGDPVRCSNFRGAFGHRHPDTRAAHHEDLCDSCLLLLCPRCFSRLRRTPGANACMACEIRGRRAISHIQQQSGRM